MVEGQGAVFRVVESEATDELVKAGPVKAQPGAGDAAFEGKREFGKTGNVREGPGVTREVRTRRARGQGTSTPKFGAAVKGCVMPRSDAERRYGIGG